VTGDSFPFHHTPQLVYTYSSILKTVGTFLELRQEEDLILTSAYFSIQPLNYQPITLHMAPQEIPFLYAEFQCELLRKHKREASVSC
jgi:hypothetical protein